ncbi:MAG TPA: GNAT family N-acetyltransferase [Streptosporangiaceae bacterium]|nr:GNAT family N-acetyltransferase [Streptosporangiaceae bacterium]
MPELRRAGTSDLDAIVDVFLDCWLITYAGTMPAGLVAAMTRERAREIWAATLATGRTEVLVADAGPGGGVRGVVGYSLPEPEAGYVASLYVSPRAQGSGTGRLLLAEAEQQMRARGARRARLWVFEDNAPSRAFYQRQGWQPDGSRETLPEFGQPQVGMAKDLAG